MESSDFRASSLRNRRNCRTICTKSERRNVSRFVAVWIGWKVVVRFHGMLLLSAKCPWYPARWENSVWTKIWGKDQLFHSAHTWNISQTPRDKARIHQFGKKVLPGIFLLDMFWSRRESGRETYWLLIEELEKMDASEIHSRSLNAKEVLITQKDGEFAFLVADGAAKLSGRDNEFQEPSLKRKQIVRSESFS